MLLPWSRWLLGAAMVVLLGCATRPQPTTAPPNTTGNSLPEPVSPGIRSRGAEVVLTALQYLDLPYRAGGLSQDVGFDCSGFTRHVYAQTLGITLPRQADDQAQSAGLQEVRREHLQPGDLVFFNTMRRAFSHVGIYVGDGRFIHAPRTGAQVRIENLGTSYWTRRYTGARRADSL